MSYDPKKEKEHIGYRQYRVLTIKVACVLLVAVGVAVAVKMQDKMVGTMDSISKEENTTQQLRPKVTESSVMEQQDSTTETTTSAGSETSEKATAPIGKKQDKDLGTLEDKEDSAALPDLPFDDDRPIFVLSLPFNGDLVMPRYFKCAGVNKVGRYWTHPDPSEAARRPLGRCLQFNMEQMMNKSSTNPISTITEGCGRQSVWMDLQYIHPPRTKGSILRSHQCFDPVLFPGALENLYKAYPQAIIVTAQHKYFPRLWLDALPKDLKTHWKKWCNPTHADAFPKSSKATATADAQYIEFYNNYYQKLDEFVEKHQGWGRVSINLDEDPDVTAKQLEEELKLPQKCWKDAVKGEMADAAGSARRPMDISFPILVTSLPKSGAATAQQYFACGLGGWTAAHQWTTPSDSTPDNPLRDVPIGQCLQQNFKIDHKKDVFKGCGHARVWSDVGFMRSTQGKCYYPTLDEDFMDAFANYYPHATIFHAVRDAKEWLTSTKVTKLPERWSAAENCVGFPDDPTEEAMWHDFYNNYTQRIRKFAASHVNMTYIEIPLTDDGAQHLQSIFGFHPKCWGTKMAREIDQ
ncbi:expressed unknown protein [Seminavis robusta]|uniref:Sulfotransferase n=1 Tax=Seminavis robusta TaxID=568900 RepID=A0A9N8EMX1_9STRA|nr:expressed unknown protein [Seminavis robusta]|eukprot:Sro1438_g272680.1 n/a (578) ;mRNA; f:13265-14998